MFRTFELLIPGIQKDLNDAGINDIYYIRSMGLLVDNFCNTEMISLAYIEDLARNEDWASIRDAARNCIKQLKSL